MPLMLAEYLLKVKLNEYTVEFAEVCLTCGAQFCSFSPIQVVSSSVKINMN